MEWRYIKPLKDKDAVEKFLNKEHVELSESLKSFIEIHNNGRPEKSRFKTEKTERVFKKLFSYNEEDKENIFSIYKGWLREVLSGANLFPLGIDPAGNIIGVTANRGNIVYFNLDMETTEYIAEDWENFLAKLY